MRDTRVFIDAALTPGSELVLPDGAATHVLRVLRLRAGATLTLFNGRGGEHAATLLDAGKRARIAVGTHRDIERESPLTITLLQGVSRGERMDLIVQKATELGVTRIIPLACDHSVVRLDEGQAARRRAHWQAVAIGACEQSGRNRLPVVDGIAPLHTVIASLQDTGASRRLLLSPGGETALPQAMAAASSATLLVGPEGGLSDNEQQLALQAGFIACRLGPRVLRTETAPLAALAVLQAVAGDLSR